MDKERKQSTGKVKMYNILFVLTAVGMVLLNIASWQSVAFSDWYIRHVFPIWLNTYARLTSLVPFSVGEIMLILAVAVTVFGIGFLLVHLISRRKYKKALVTFGKFYIWTVLIVSCVMTLNCFILYHGSSFSEKYMVREADSGMMVAALSEKAAAQVYSSAGDGERIYTKEELVVLRDYIVERCNALAGQVQRDDSGAVYYDGDLIAVSREAMQKLGEEYDQLAGFYVTPKYLKGSAFFSQQYIMGYYFPFSLEANINSVMYITNVAPTVCHELAHTKGFIFEDDANLIGFLACINSEDLFLQYCGYLSVLDYINDDFFDAIGKNKEEYKRHVRISDTVANDNIFLTPEDWVDVEKKAVVKTSTVKKVSETFTDTTLKLNGVEEGKLQYGQVVGLLLMYYDGELY